MGCRGAVGKALELSALGDCNAGSNESTGHDQQFHGHIGSQSDDRNNHGKTSLAESVWFLCVGLVYKLLARRSGYVTESWLIACFQPVAFVLSL